MVLVTQTRACKVARDKFSKLPQCFVCAGRSGSDECRFSGALSIVNRYIYLPSAGRPAGSRTVDTTAKNNSVVFNFPPEDDPHFPTVFSRDMTLQIAKFKMVCSTQWDWMNLDSTI
jgi:hypothetical protein